jgi:hypothetical protein
MTRFHVTGEAEDILRTAIDSHGRKTFQGYCTCGHDRKMLTWREENQHSPKCGATCKCGLWAELGRKLESMQHSSSCCRSKPVLSHAGRMVYEEDDAILVSHYESEGFWPLWALSLRNTCAAA